MVCNKRIKFGSLLQAARSVGASRLATGHYARTAEIGQEGLRLRKGADPKKDQSYFLAFLTEEQLRSALFPLGRLHKTAVMRVAARCGLRPVSSRESQDVCFIRGGSYRDFLAGMPEFSAMPGPIVDADGQVVGEHKGLHRFTVGQRRGIDCPGPQPYYVLCLDGENNRLVVGTKDQLYRSRCRLSGVRWSGRTPEDPVRVSVRVRYRSAAVPAVVTPEEGEGAVVRFERPQAAVTAGQAAVFYRGDIVEGAGWIEPPRDLPFSQRIGSESLEKGPGRFGRREFSWGGRSEKDGTIR
jgi:tRNA-specific 2-thiouridylase